VLAGLALQALPVPPVLPVLPVLPRPSLYPPLGLPHRRLMCSSLEEAGLARPLRAEATGLRGSPDG